MNLVPIWASPSPGDLVPLLDLIGVDTFLASPGTGDSDPIERHHDLVTLVLTWASLVPGDFVPHLDLIAVNSFLASPATGDSDPICASPRSGDSGPHLGIIGTRLLCSTPEPHLDMMTLEPFCVSP